MFVCLVCATTALPALIMELGDYDTLAHARSHTRTRTRTVKLKNTGDESKLHVAPQPRRHAGGAGPGLLARHRILRSD